MLSNDFVQSINLICDRIPVSGAATWGWIQRTLLTGLAEKYKYQGIEVLWDESLQYWCSKNEISCTCQSDWERLIDDQLNAILVSKLFESDFTPHQKVVVKFDYLVDAVQITGV